MEESERPTTHESIRRVIPVAIDVTTLEHGVLNLEQLALDLDVRPCGIALRELADVEATADCE